LSIGEGQHLCDDRAVMHAQVPVPQRADRVGFHLAAAGERIDGGDPLGEVGRPAGEVERGPVRSRDGRRPQPCDLVRIDAFTVHSQPVAATVVREQHVDRCIGRPAGRAPQLRRRIPGDDPAPGDEHPGCTGPQRKIHLEQRGRVHIREEPLVAGSAQDTWRQQPGGDGGGAPERGGQVDRHAEPDGSGPATVP